MNAPATPTRAAPALCLTRLRVEQWRRFREPFELAGLAPGLNVIGAPNESGKSSLVRAIRAAFLERHRSAAVDDLRPWGDGSAAPTVELDFLADGQPAQLRKSFLGRKRCHLQIGARQWEGVEAEDHLAQWLGFQFALKGASRAEHWGIPGLLWVEQGAGHELAVEHARAPLHDALGGEAAAGVLAAGGGDALLNTLKAQRAELLTAGGKARGVLSEVAAQVEALVARQAHEQAQLQTYRSQVDRLAVLRQAHEADERRQPWRGLREQLAAAERQAQALQAQAARLADDRRRLDECRRNAELRAERLSVWAAQAQAAAQRAQAWSEAREALQAADTAERLATQRAQALQQRLDERAEGLRLARQAARRLQLQEQAREAAASVDRLAAALKKAGEEQARVLALQAESAGELLSPEGLERLRQLDRRARDAALRLEALATRMDHSLPPGQTVRLQHGGVEQRLEGEGQRWIEGPVTLELPGGGRLSLQPGGQDLGARAQERTDAQAALTAALAAAGLESLADAEARMVRQRDRQGLLRLAQQALEIYAPDGLDALQQALATEQARAAALAEALQALPAADGALPSLADAELAHQAASQEVQLARQAQAQAEGQRLTARTRTEEAEREHGRARALMDEAGRSEREAVCRDELTALRQEAERLSAQIEQAEAQLQAARPEFVQQDIERLRRSAEQAEAAHQERARELLALDIRLQEQGATGLEEGLERLAVELAAARRRHDELQRRADALDLLCERLEARRQATLERLQRPLLERLQHYLPLLWPGASLQLGQDLAPAGMSRPDAAGRLETGEVEALSFGAREQLRLISRFAYADLLQAAGRPTLLVLDDVLTHSDGQRLAQMKRVLFDVARRHQLLLFTCHPEWWQDLGVPVRSLG